MTTPHDRQSDGGRPDAADAALERLFERMVEANAAVEPPSDLIDRIERQLDDPAPPVFILRPRVLAGGALVAAVLLLALTVWIRFGASSEPAPVVREDGPGPTTTFPEAPSPTATAHIAPGVAVEPADGWFAQPLATRNPRVSVVILHREYRAPAPEAESAEPRSDA